MPATVLGLLRAVHYRQMRRAHALATHNKFACISEIYVYTVVLIFTLRYFEFVLCGARSYNAVSCLKEE